MGDGKERFDESNWSHRVCCRDGNCIGTVDSSGRCQVCDLKYEGELPFIIDNCESVRTDSLEEQAKKLLPTVNILAISSFTNFCEQFPVLSGIDSNRWDYYFTITGICAGLMDLADKVASEERYNKITEVFQKELLEWDSSAEDAMSGCMMYIQNRLGVDVPDDPQDAFNGLAYVLGKFLLTSVFDRSLSAEEDNHAIIVGRFILTSLHNYWDWWSER